VKQRTSNVFSANTKSTLAPAIAKKTSLLILLEAVGDRIQKIKNPVHAHPWAIVAIMAGKTQIFDREKIVPTF